MIANQAARPQNIPGYHLARWEMLRRMVLLASLLLVVLPPIGAASGKERLRFEGQVTLPPHTFSPKKRLTIWLHGVDTPYASHTWADGSGRFHFGNLTPGIYSLAIYIPDDGEIVQTVDITRSFADSKRKVQKQFVFDEERLRLLLNSIPQSLVSVRQLSIPFRSNDEYRKAQNRLERHDVEGAIRHLQRAVELAPQFVEALNHLGTISFQRREFSKAEHYFRQALDQDPRAYEPLVNLGGALLAQRRDREALAINLHAQNARPRDPLANAQLGLSYFAVGEYERAIQCFQVTEELDPAHFSNPQITLAEIYLRRADSGAALRELEAFLKVHPDSAQAQTVRAAIDRLKNTQSEPDNSINHERHEKHERV